MKNSISAQVAYITLLISFIILGIILPEMLFTEHVLIFQIICSLLFISPIIYSKCKADKNQSKLMDKILYLSRHDDLTNAYNRRHFEELFLHSIGENMDLNKKCCLVYLDIDNLKVINDTLGHHIGDQAILTFSKAIRDNIRKTDLFARYGGDEFIVVFFNIEHQLIENKLEKIKQQLQENPIYYNGEKVVIQFSYGISNFPEDANEFKELINIADRRMYSDKKGLKNLV